MNMTCSKVTHQNTVEWFSGTSYSLSKAHAPSKNEVKIIKNARSTLQWLDASISQAVGVHHTPYCKEPHIFAGAGAGATIGIGIHFFHPPLLLSQDFTTTLLLTATTCALPIRCSTLPRRMSHGRWLRPRQQPERMLALLATCFHFQQFAAVASKAWSVEESLIVSLVAAHPCVRTFMFDMRIIATKWWTQKDHSSLGR